MCIYVWVFNSIFACKVFVTLLALNSSMYQSEMFREEITLLVGALLDTAFMEVEKFKNTSTLDKHIFM